MLFSYEYPPKKEKKERKTKGPIWYMDLNYKTGKIGISPSSIGFRIEKTILKKE